MNRRRMIRQKAGLGVAAGAMISFVIDGILWPVTGLVMVLGAATPLYDVGRDLYGLYHAEPAGTEGAGLEALSQRPVDDG